MAEPVPPTNFRAILPDDTEIPLELYYDGRNPEGLHVWVATVPVRAAQRGRLRFTCDELPAMTTISVCLELPPGLRIGPGATIAHDGLPPEPYDVPPPWRRAPGGAHN